MSSRGSYLDKLVDKIGKRDEQIAVTLFNEATLSGVVQAVGDDHIVVADAIIPLHAIVCIRRR